MMRSVDPDKSRERDGTTVAVLFIVAAVVVAVAIAYFAFVMPGMDEGGDGMGDMDMGAPRSASAVAD